jgi:adenine C2-methylase RlmN of 23S rRNA A2503 and tRNA A37
LEKHKTCTNLEIIEKKESSDADGNQLLTSFMKAGHFVEQTYHPEENRTYLKGYPPN